LTPNVANVLFVPVPPVTALPTLTSAIGRLTQSLNDLTTTHAKDVSSIAALEDERTKLDAREAEMREMIKEAEEKRSWFAAFREWVEGVAAFLDEKVRTRSLPAINTCIDFVCPAHQVPRTGKTRGRTRLSLEGTV
jgi:hypothetical protein